ncbi:MAG: DUF2808 domain-containing protein [Rivularia sp. (in: cyanobacteria)]
MKLVILLSTLLTCIIGIESLIVRTARSVELQDGKVYFRQPPRLLKAVTTFDSVNVWSATYYFTVKLPTYAGEPLQKITINQHSGLDDINFDLRDSFAMIGVRKREKEKLKVEITSKPSAKTVTLIFNPPVSPGKTITIALKPTKNPAAEGIYLFGVTAFPAGEQSHGQFLGYGRLHFYRDNS